MNQEQAKKAIAALGKNYDPDLVDWNNVSNEIVRGEKGRLPAEIPVLAILRQHRDYIQAEDAALAVWREVFVGQAIRVDGWGKLAGAASIADEAETQFRRRFADYLKAKG